MSTNPRPLQVRLPQDVYASLEHEARGRGATMNSIVVECLKENLAPATPLDAAMVKGDAVCLDRSPDGIKRFLLVHLEQYTNHLFNESAALQEAAQARVNQARWAIAMTQEVRESWLQAEVTLPKSLEQSDFVTEDGKLSPLVITYLNANNHRKVDRHAKGALKMAARERLEAVQEWRMVQDGIALRDQVRGQQK